MRWLATPGDAARHVGASVEFSAGPTTDWFRDPRTGSVTQNAPIAIVAEGSPVTVSCTVEATLRSTFDAAGLFVHVDDEHWVKLALERSPAGRPTVVSVHTDGRSDDCNHVEVDGPDCRLRVTLDDRSVGLHVGDADGRWRLLRYCTKPGAGRPVVGLIVQSPTGAGATGTFRDLVVTDAAVDDLRDGS